MRRSSNDKARERDKKIYNGNERTHCIHLLYRKFEYA